MPPEMKMEHEILATMITSDPAKTSWRTLCSHPILA